VNRKTIVVLAAGTLLGLIGSADASEPS